MVKFKILKLYSLLMYIGVCAAFAFTSNVNAQDLSSQGWRKISPQEITDNPFVLFKDNWMALAAGTQSDMNAMTISWGGLGTLWGQSDPVVTVYVNPTRHTHGFLERNEYFTVTAFPEQFRSSLQYLGTRSGRNEKDKIEGSGLTVSYTELGNPIFNEGRLAIECRKVYAAPFDSSGFGEKAKLFYGEGTGRQPNTVFIGDIVNVWIK